MDSNVSLGKIALIQPQKSAKLSRTQHNQQQQAQLTETSSTTKTTTGPTRRISWLKAYHSAKCDRKLNQVTKASDVEDVLFNLLSDPRFDRVSVGKFWTAVKSAGLRPSDPRLRECRVQFSRVRKETNVPVDDEEDITVNRETFTRCVAQNIWVIGRAFKKDFIIPEFHGFTQQIENIYLKCKENHEGKIADYIPQLARVSPESWGVSLCTIDGQRCAYGDTEQPFCLQSCCMPLNYALAVSELGADCVHDYVGFEPSGGTYNDLSLNHNQKPHNPMVNAGAIVTLSLLQPKASAADRFDNVFCEYRRLAGGEYVGFNNAVYLSERNTSDRNFAIAYNLAEKKCFPEGVNLLETLEFHFQLCSVEVTAESGAVIAATLANGGICPITGERVLAAEAVRNTLSLMHCCGMYDYSGQFAFKVGLPAKSGIGGAVLVVVPRVMGICCWGPQLDHHGNSVKGVQFCEELVDVFNFHNYDILNRTDNKVDPRIRRAETLATSVVNLLFGAANGDITSIRRFALFGMNMSAKDYDGRTALHVAAGQGHLAVVRMLVEQCRVQTDLKDRWGFTALDDALRFNRKAVADYLLTRKKTHPPQE